MLLPPESHTNRQGPPMNEYFEKYRLTPRSPERRFNCRSGRDRDDDDGGGGGGERANQSTLITEL